MKTNSLVENKIIIIQKWFRGCIFILHKSNRLHLIRYKIKKYLNHIHKQFTENEDDVIELLIEKFGCNIKKFQIRMWYDFLAFDYIYDLDNLIL
jgi:hypothetical protein